MTTAKFLQFSVTNSFDFEWHGKCLDINLLLFRDISEGDFDFTRLLFWKLVFRVAGVRMTFLEFIFK